MMEPIEMLTVKELARTLRKHISYVYAMRSLGFQMPAGLATLQEARAWLVNHPSPRGYRHAKKR